MVNLIEEIKEKLINQLQLEDYGTKDIDTDEALFGDGLGLDSIDALELIVLLERDYNIKIMDPKKAKHIFKSVRTMAEHIKSHQVA